MGVKWVFAEHVNQASVDPKSIKCKWQTSSEITYDAIVKNQNKAKTDFVDVSDCQKPDNLPQIRTKQAKTLLKFLSNTVSCVQWMSKTKERNSKVAENEHQHGSVNNYKRQFHVFTRLKKCRLPNKEIVGDLTQSSNRNLSCFADLSV